MKLKCPECLELLTNEYRCSNDHVFHMNDGVLQLMTDQFGSELTQWLKFFENHRENQISSYTYDLLPQAGFTTNQALWKARTADLKLILQQINPTTHTALDIGSWNGWLANKLSKKQLDVTGIDYFLHKDDGLKARNNYQEANWRSIQMDIEALDAFDSTFDLIVVNRMISYVTDLAAFISSCKERLSPTGMLIITGINVSFKNAKEYEQMRREKIEFQEKYNTPLQFRVSKGYMEEEDLTYLTSQGFHVRLYPGIKNAMKKLIWKKRVSSFYAIYTAND